MAKSGQSSFRRTLLFRILLLSIPVLLAGEYFAYRKARSILLETARQNLTESAVRKGESIRDLTDAMRTNLLSASEAFSAQGDQRYTAQEFVSRMARWFPKGFQCVQVTNIQTGQLEASTCGKQRIEQQADTRWPTQSQIILDPRSTVRILPVDSTNLVRHAASLRQLDLVFSAPVYDSFGQLRYVLSVQSALHRQEASQPGSLSGETVVIDQDGIILAHPKSDRIGRSIQQEDDWKNLQEIVNNAIAGNQDFLHLFSYQEDEEEWLAGFAPVQISMNSKEKRTWVVLATAPMKNVLYGLEEIKQVLVILTLGLIAANLLATIYIARDLAMPLEQLGQYALHIFQRYPAERVPKDFKIREMNQLGEALESMIRQLEERAEELESAWQEAQAANQLKSEFLATTSHELRTPLNGIIGCIRLVRDGCCDSREEELEFLQQADESAIHLLKIINDLLDIAKIESGKMELHLQSLLVQDLCEQCLRMVQTSAESKNLLLSREVDPQLNRVLLDEQRVRQMVINLLTNAVKFTPEGGHVKLKGWVGYGHQLSQDMRPDHSPVNPNTSYLCMEVQDSGIGIPKDRWHLLFRPFQQIDSSLTRKYEGTGLGLSLTKRLAELHGGTISFQSTPGKGSTFRIWLPLREQTANGSGGGDASGNGSQIPVGEMKDASLIDAPDNPVSSVG